MELSGSSALVVGGAGGFGSATVRRLVQAGARVVIADMADDRGKEFADELDGRAVYVRTDVTSEESVDAAVDAATGLGPLRTTVIVRRGPTAGKRLVNREGNAYPVETFRRTTEIYLIGTFTVLSKAAAAMTRNEPLDSGQRGVIVTTASIAGYEGQVGQTDYSAAKGGVIGLNLTAARDLAPAGGAGRVHRARRLLHPRLPDGRGRGAGEVGRRRAQPEDARAAGAPGPRAR